MLAQNFKTAKDLEITEAQKEALMKTLVLLETEQVEHISKFINDIDHEPTYCGKFNMRYWNAEASCGTVCCIGGTAELIGNVSFYPNVPVALEELFQPPMGPAIWRTITPAEAAIALRSYLTTGAARWDLAAPRSPETPHHDFMAWHRYFRRAGDCFGEHLQAAGKNC